MKSPQDLCHVEYIMYRRQVRQIHRLAQEAGQRPSEFLRAVLDDMLTIPEGLKRHE